MPAAFRCEAVQREGKEAAGGRPPAGSGTRRKGRAAAAAIPFRAPRSRQVQGKKAGPPGHAEQRLKMLPLSLEFGERLRCRRNKERERSFAGAAGKCGKPHGFSGREMLPGGSDGRIGDKWGKSGEAGAEAAGRQGPCGGPGPGRDMRLGAATCRPSCRICPGAGLSGGSSAPEGP